MKFNSTFKLIISIFVVIMILPVFSGCAGNPFSAQPAETRQDTVGPKSKKTTAVYHDFEDVLIPLELSVVKNRTVIVSTPGFTSGILTLKGRVERGSLFNFFNTNMARDNWNVISQIKSPGTTIMVFQKSSRTSVITIRDEQLYTYVEVGVAPTVNVPADVSESSLFE
jgi:hypothetical protein